MAEYVSKKYDYGIFLKLHSIADSVMHTIWTKHNKELKDILLEITKKYIYTDDYKKALLRLLVREHRGKHRIGYHSDALLLFPDVKLGAYYEENPPILITEFIEPPDWLKELAIINKVVKIPALQMGLSPYVWCPNDILSSSVKKYLFGEVIITDIPLEVLEDVAKEYAKIYDIQYKEIKCRKTEHEDTVEYVCYADGKPLFDLVLHK